jgi:hypothetical protein
VDNGGGGDLVMTEVVRLKLVVNVGETSVYET